MTRWRPYPTITATSHQENWVQTPSTISAASHSLPCRATIATGLRLSAKAHHKSGVWSASSRTPAATVTGRAQASPVAAQTAPPAADESARCLLGLKWRLSSAIRGRVGGSCEEHPHRMKGPAEGVEHQAQDLQSHHAQDRFVSRLPEDHRRMAFALGKQNMALGDAPAHPLCRRPGLKLISRFAASPMDCNTGAGRSEYVAPLSTKNRTVSSFLSSSSGPRTAPSV